MNGEKLAFDMRSVVKQLKKNTETRRMARAMHAYKPGKVPLVVFNEMAALVALSALEVVPYMMEGEKQFVFLTKRDPDDRFWPNQWHCPGTVVIGNDAVQEGDLSEPWKRLKRREFMQQSLEEPTYVSHKLIKTKRGDEVALIYKVEVPGNLKGGGYFPIDELPDNLMDHHRILISEAIKQPELKND